MNETKLWTKDFIITSTINFLLTSVFYLLVVIVAVYAKTEFHATTSQAGLATGIFIIATLIGRLFIGRGINSIGYKRTLLIGTCLFALSSFLYFIQLNIWFFLVVRFLHGLTLGIAGTATGTIVAQVIPNSRKGEGIGYYSMSSTLATAIGPFIGLLLSQHVSFLIVFGLCTLLGIIAFITSFFIQVTEPEEVKKAEKDVKGFKLSNFIEPKAIPISFIMLIAALCYSGVLSFMNFYAQEIGLMEASSFFFFVYSIAILCSRPFSGRLLDVKGPNYVMYPAFILFSIGLIVLSAAHNSFVLLFSGVLIGLGYGNMQSCIQAVAVKVTTIHRMGLATSTFFIFLDAGLGFGPYLLGFIEPYTTYSQLYFSLSFVVLATVILYFFLHGRKVKNFQ
jgi:MFS family permease